MQDQSLIEIINQEMDLDFPADTVFAAMRLKLQQVINDWVNHDFQRLVSVLYRVDVNERKLKYLLQENVGEDAAVIIADLIIARQMEKLETRRQFRQDDSSISDEERW